MPIADSNIALAARDQLPETWDALLEANTFGEAALERRLAVVQYRLFGAVLTPEEEAAMSPLLVEYCGVLLALELIVPGLDFWSKQAISHSAGERESKAYKDRAEDLKELRDLLFKKAADLLDEVEDELPLLPKRVGDTARVTDSGNVIGQDLLVTTDPTIFQPMYGPPEETTTG